jgi:hypothetical protein
MIPAPSLLQLSPGIKIKDQTPKSKKPEPKPKKWNQKNQNVFR